MAEIDLHAGRVSASHATDNRCQNLTSAGSVEGTDGGSPECHLPSCLVFLTANRLSLYYIVAIRFS
jgi:hypothetical protein